MMKIIRELHPGDYFGEISLLTNLRRTTSIFSGKEMNLTCGKIETDDFMALLSENPELKAFLKMQIDRYSDKNFKFLWIMLKNQPFLRHASKESIR